MIFFSEASLLRGFSFSGGKDVPSTPLPPSKVCKVFQKGYLGWYLERFECTCAEGRGALVAGLVGFGGGICQVRQALETRAPVVSKAKVRGSVTASWEVLSSQMRIWVRR